MGVVLGTGSVWCCMCDKNLAACRAMEPQGAGLADQVPVLFCPSCCDVAHAALLSGWCGDHQGCLGGWRTLHCACHAGHSGLAVCRCNFSTFGLGLHLASRRVGTSRCPGPTHVSDVSLSPQRGQRHCLLLVRVQHPQPPGGGVRARHGRGARRQAATPYPRAALLRADLGGGLP